MSFVSLKNVNKQYKGKYMKLTLIIGAAILGIVMIFGVMIISSKNSAISLAILSILNL